MKWPQFELWRLFAATALIAVGLGLVQAAGRPNQSFRVGFDLLALVFLGAGIGFPFRRARLGLYAVVVLIALFVLFAMFVDVARVLRQL